MSPEPQHHAPSVSDLCLGGTSRKKVVHHERCHHARDPYEWARSMPNAAILAYELVASGAWRWHHFCQACCGDIDDEVRAAIRAAEEAIGAPL